MNFIFFFVYFLCVVFCFFFFCFHAEDGIRDWSVTGVQTCALPIWWFDAATARGIVPPAPGSVERLRPSVAAHVRSEHELEVEDRSDGADLDQLPHLAPIGFVAQLVVDTGQPTAPLRDLEHLLRLPDRERHRLLAQHVLPLLQRSDRVTGVGVGRRGHDDEVDLGSAGERLTAPECVGNAELRRDGAGALHAAARDRGHRYPRHEAQGRDLHPTREPRADQPDAQRHNVVRQETVSVSSGTASNDASSATRPAAAVSSPVPRATTVRTGPVARTSTTPLSSVKPRATSFIMYRTPTVAPRGDTVSPRCSSEIGRAHV